MQKYPNSTIFVPTITRKKQKLYQVQSYNETKSLYTLVNILENKPDQSVILLDQAYVENEENFVVYDDGEIIDWGGENKRGI